MPWRGGPPPPQPQFPRREDALDERFEKRWQAVRLAVSHTDNMSATELDARIQVVLKALEVDR